MTDVVAPADLYQGLTSVAPSQRFATLVGRAIVRGTNS
jgi:hypothetical protein